jgi:hypothetical protein
MRESSAPTETLRKSCRTASELFAPVLGQLRTIVEAEMQAFAD